jgi:1-hydroxycarotenoid 3,4-desaturase
MGGLAAAIDLSAAGVPVTLIEGADAPGGKLREVEVGGALIDCGPTVLTMRWVFDELFAAAGARLEERLPLERAQVLARHAWSEGERLDLFADPASSAEAIGRLAGPAAARGFEQFRKRAREVYQTLEESFIRGARPTPMGLVLGAGGVAQLLRIKPFETLWNEVGSFFADRRLRQLFGRYATYCGSSPLLAPATLMLVAHVEMEGVWRVGGGMQRLPEAMAKLAAEQGARLRFGAPVAEVLVERGRAAGVLLASGERLPAEAVVLNADVSALAAGKLGQAARQVVGPVAQEARSLSALTVALHAEAGGFPLSRHNVFFSQDSEQEFDDLVESRRLPREPTVYVCAQDRGDGAPGEPESPSHRERLFCIINAPATGDRERFTRADIDPCLRRGTQVLRRCGLELRLEEAEAVTTPAQFEARFPGTGGALYGRATHGAMATFQRPGAETKLPGLFLAGGSVHPGPGVPMAALSGRLAARTLLLSLPSTARSRRAATPGGTSTP